MSFQLVAVERKCGITGYIWESKNKDYFEEYKFTEIFLTAMNLYLGRSSDRELKGLLNGNTNFLKVQCYQQGKKSRISVISLAIDSLNDPYKKLITSCRKDMFPVEINLDSAHYLGCNRIMCRTRNLT